MQTIWKYEIEPDFVIQEYELPKGAIICSFGLDPYGKMCFWAQVNDQAPKEKHLVACVGTGWPIDNVLGAKSQYVCFINTLVQGEFVWHLFDLGASPASMADEVVTLRKPEEAMPQC